MQEKHAIPTDRSVELLKELHILTRDGRLNQDSRRKLKQVEHLIGFIDPLINEIKSKRAEVQLADIGAGGVAVHGIETRAALVDRSRALAARLGFEGMRFHRLDAASAHEDGGLPARIDIVTALPANAVEPAGAGRSAQALFHS